MVDSVKEKNFKGISIKKGSINPMIRKDYKNLKELEIDEELLKKSFKDVDNKFQKAMYLPLVIHFLESRKTLGVARLGDKIQLKTLYAQQYAFKRLLKKWGVPYYEHTRTKTETKKSK